MHGSKVGRRGLAGAVLAGVLVLGACSGDDGGATPTTAADTGATTTVAEAPSGADVVLADDGIGVAAFGDAVDVVLGTVTASFGRGGVDSGWGGTTTQWGVCPGTQTRSVIYDRFAVIFGDESPYGTGKQHLMGWRLDGFLPDNGLALPRTADGLTIGSTVADLKRVYGADKVTLENTGLIGGTTFAVAGTSLRGQLTTIEDDGTVVAIQGGVVCEPASS